ncbi:MAG: O-antigen ligase family protein [Hyphomonas sp.]|uniref:O-antigen ligase family protein n=1 Tax=Hyphomonas sp. TaxID=87 RepID=UPI00352752B7
MNVAKPLEFDNDRHLVWANLYSDERTPPLWEQAMVTLWFFLTFFPIPGASPVLYLLMASMLGIFAMDKEVIFPVLLKSWPLLLLPAFGILSFMWSPHSSAAFREGVLHALTAIVAVVIASRMGIRYVLRCLMIASWLAALYIFPHGEFSVNGPYGSKNFVALQMTFMALLSFLCILNKRELIWLRIAAALFVPLGAYIVLSADSATSLVFVIVGPLALVGAKIFWVDIASDKFTRTWLLLIAVILFLSAMLVLLIFPVGGMEDAFLNLLGRDRTLTGRTTIWMAGRVVQDQHPIFGTGLAGFWNPENGAAQSINFYDFKPAGTKLSFHNAYMEVRVHLGWIGFWLYVVSWSWCSFRIIKTWLTSRHIEASFLIIAMVLVFVSTFTESWAFSTFMTPVNLLFMGAIATLGGSRKQLVGKVPVVIAPESGTRSFAVTP